MIIQFIKLHSDLPEEELLKRAHERAPRFREIKGLVQKYYVKLGDNRYGGFYIWDSPESLMAFRESELATSIPQAYEIKEAPEVELLNVMFKLRE